MPHEPSQRVDQVVDNLTRAKRYVFVAMSYNTQWAFYTRVRDIITQTTGLMCIRADEIPGSGHELLSKVHLLIERAELMVAEISQGSPNVFYEVGYAVGANRPIMLLANQGVKMPTDLQGLELLTYDETRHGIETFELRLREHLEARLNSEVPVLRDMLEGPEPQPVCILASPKNRPSGNVSAQSRPRTFGDNLGIMGLVRTFGQIMGEGVALELVSAEYCPKNVLDQECNLYLIGSPKVNPFTAEMMQVLQRGSEPGWRFLPSPDDTVDLDYEIVLHRKVNGEDHPLKAEGVVMPEGHKIWKKDYGIIIRAPHPYQKNRVVCIMAGAHSLGTGAACLAATRTALIREIRDALPSKVLADKQASFWALVQGTASEGDGLLDMEGVRVLEAGVL